MDLKAKTPKTVCRNRNLHKKIVRKFFEKFSKKSQTGLIVQKKFKGSSLKGLPWEEGFGRKIQKSSTVPKKNDLVFPLLLQA